MRKIGIYIKQNNSNLKIEMSLPKGTRGNSVYPSWYYAFDLLGGCLQLAFYPWLRRRRLHVESAIPDETNHRRRQKIMVIQ